MQTYSVTKPEVPSSSWLPMIPIVLLFGMSFLPDIQANQTLLLSFWGSTLLLLAGYGLTRARHSSGLPTLRIHLQPTHYVQVVMHSSIYAYWGWHWPQVYDQIDLILAQVVFAYGLEFLLSWNHRNELTLSLGPIPIVFSTNLFLWFRDDWFYLQFAMIALAFLTKEFVRWQREGHSTHIFNPSSFPLALFGLILVLTHSTELGWGAQIAIHLGDPDHMYWWIFVVGLIVQGLFGITLITAGAAITLVVFNLIYTQITGVYYFFDATIQIAVFLGLHLLITDPVTSPRSELGRLIFGALYGTSVIILYALLGNLGAPTFYDKLLAVPLLNLLVPVIDGLVKRYGTDRWDPRRLVPNWTTVQRNYAYVVLWASIFLVFNLTGLVANQHPGQDPAFWRQACAEDRVNACGNLQVMQREYCSRRVASACLDVGDLAVGGKLPGNPVEVMGAYRAACELGEARGCAEILQRVLGRPPLTSTATYEAPSEADLRNAVQAEKIGYPVSEILERSCDLGNDRDCRLLSELR